jgi:hypothetical protein
VRVMRHGEYPPPRGACLSLGDRRYLYTTGYVPSLGRYPHGHVPTPVQVFLESPWLGWCALAG